MGVTSEVQALVAPLLDERGLDLYDVEMAGATLRVLVDRPGGSVDLEVLGDLARRMSALLDATDPVPGRYTLEVSSPGLERPLRTRRHFEAAAGARVKVKTAPGTGTERRLEGDLGGVDDEGFTLATEAGTRRVRFDDVERARTVFVWKPAERPGPSRGRRTTTAARP